MPQSAHLPLCGQSGEGAEADSVVEDDAWTGAIGIVDESVEESGFDEEQAARETASTSNAQRFFIAVRFY